jgi:UPF0271 protein
VHVDLNSDMGESYAAWTMGNDGAMYDIISSANLACGFHAGDPDVMFEGCKTAREKGVAVGAHPGFNDIAGFGRRVIRGDTMAQIERMVAYQIGALQAMATMAGHRVTFVKAHGALGNLANAEDDFAMAIGRAIKAVEPRLVYVVMPGLATERAADRLGLPMAREFFADRTYDPDGQLTNRKKPGAVLHDVEYAAARALETVQEGAVTTVTGSKIKIAIDTICVHGDSPAAVTMARAVRAALEGAGIAIRPFAPAGAAGSA